MKKRLLLVVFTACLILVISSCGKKKLSGFDKLVNDIYASESILAGYNERMQEFMNINEGLKSRIPYWVDFPDYDTEELTEIFKIFCPTG